MHRLLQSRTVGNMAWVGAASAASALLGAVSSGIYGRTLGVADFGILTLIVSLMTMMVSFSDLGISGSIVRFASEAIGRNDTNRVRSVLSVALKGKVMLSAVVVLGALLFLNPIVSAVFSRADEQITSYFLLSLVAVAAGMAASFLPPIYQSYQRFRTQAIIATVPPLLKVGAVAIFAFGISSLTIGIGIWIEVGTAVVLFTLGWMWLPVRGLQWGGGDGGLRRQMLSFNKWLSVYYVLNLVGGRVDLFLVGGILDAHALGLYGSASKIASMVLIASNAYLTVLLPDLSSALNPDLLRKKVGQAFTVGAFFVAGIAVLALLADLVILVIFGGAFAGASAVLRIMCIGLTFTVLATPLNAALFARGESFAFPVMSAAAIAALLLGNAFLIPRFGVEGGAAAYSLSGAVGFLTSTVIYFGISRRRTA
ncbi:MAG: oligosaccharide flippase family protein [Bacteroidota bacterium]